MLLSRKVGEVLGAEGMQPPRCARHGSFESYQHVSDGGRFVGRHARPQQGRDGDGGDDGDDGHHDQQLDEREAWRGACFRFHLLSSPPGWEGGR
jgi:hypothetical protein